MKTITAFAAGVLAASILSALSRRGLTPAPYVWTSGPQILKQWVDKGRVLTKWSDGVVTRAATVGSDFYVGDQ